MTRFQSMMLIVRTFSYWSIVYCCIYMTLSRSFSSFRLNGMLIHTSYVVGVLFLLTLMKLSHCCFFSIVVLGLSNVGPPARNACQDLHVYSWRELWGGGVKNRRDCNAAITDRSFYILGFNLIPVKFSHLTQTWPVTLMSAASSLSHPLFYLLKTVSLGQTLMWNRSNLSGRYC